MSRQPLEPSLDPEMMDVICRFIECRVRQARAEGAVLGLSGGLDSTVVGALCARALGCDRVLGVLMPDERPEPEALLAAKWLRVPHVVVPIGGLVEGFLRGMEKAAAGREKSGKRGKRGGERRGPSGGRAGTRKSQVFARVVVGNVKARVRMVLLYLEANRSGRLVVGTGNKSEILTGYFTKYGDGGADILPIGDLYKMQVKALAEVLGVPARIRRLVPTAGLYPGQTDEAELGVPYETLDRILLGLELGLGREELARRAGASLLAVDRVLGLVERSAHKRLLPQIPKLGIRTVGLDWREGLLHPEQ